MGWIQKFLDWRKQRQQVTSTSDAGWRTLTGGSGWTEAAPVRAQQALGFPAFACATRIICDTVASLPVKVWRQEADGSQEQVFGEEVDILNNRWSQFETAFDAKRKLIKSAILHDAGFAWVFKRSRDRKARGLVVLNPTSVTRQEDGSYIQRDPSLRNVPERIPPERMIEVNFMQLPDDSGVSALNLAQGVLRMGLFAQKHAAELFRRGAVPKVVLQSHNADTGEAAAEEFSHMEEALVRMAESGRTALFAPPGYEFKPLAATSQHTQLVEMLKLAVEEVARVFNIPTQMLHSTEGSTYSNQEQAGQNLSKNTILPWTRQLEQQISSKFLQAKQKAEFDVSKLVRADFLTEGDGFARRIQSGQMTPNEARIAQGLPPVDQEKADDLLIQGAIKALGDEPEPPVAPVGMPPEADPNNGEDNEA